ncbi:hypothetical protein IJJ37_03425 [Candidatus Saccharibacteria bacterium]|nr:hypothetical protein [Candidatus Saccharibacteria bacterium]
MADYVLARKSRNIASSAVHVFLNILLGVMAVLITVFSGSPLIGILLVLVSKWRIFAVRRRYLWINLKANLVDLIVGLSVVLLAAFAGSSLAPVHFVLMAVYVLWLLVLKPMSSETANLAQSLVAVFLGISVVMLMSDVFKLNAVVCVLLAFLIGYAASRHVLVQTDAQDFTLTTLVCGLVFAEIAWMCNSWMIVYSLGNTGIMIPQAAIILTIFAFVYNYARQAMVKYQENFRFKDILGPVVFGVVLIGILVIGFSSPTIILNRARSAAQPTNSSSTTENK